MVPKLRFEGFNKNWAVKKLENVFSFKNGLNASKEMYGKGIKFINVLDIINNEKITFDVIQESVEATNEQISTYQVRQGDIVFQRSSETRDEVGQANVYADSETVLFGGFVIRARPLININSTFLNFQLKTDALRKDITQRSGGSTRYNIGQDSLGKVTAFFPEIREQEKIANFLSSVDEKMALLNKQYELLCQYKKGMMQKIFSQEVRFKNENDKDFPEWEQKKIREITSLIKDGTHGTHNNVTESDFFLLSAKNIQEGKVAIDKNDRKISEIEFRAIFKNYNLAQGDILLSVVGTIGRVAIYSEQYANYAFQRSVAFFRFTQDLPEFIYQLFNATKFQKELIIRQVISAQPGIYLGDLADISLEIPVQKEQMKIANFLSALDDKIAAKKVELDKLKTWKQGLLQQMFV